MRLLDVLWTLYGLNQRVFRSGKYAGSMVKQHRNMPPFGDRIPTREEALRRAALCLAEARRIADSLSVEDQACRALVAGGPSYDELVKRIRASRRRRGIPE